MTYSFCKEFRHLLFGHVGPDGDVSVTAVMQRLFDLGFGRSASRSLSLSQAWFFKDRLLYCSLPEVITAAEQWAREIQF